MAVKVYIHAMQRPHAHGFSVTFTTNDLRENDKLREVINLMGELADEGEGIGVYESHR